MKKRSCILSFIITLVLCASAYAAVEPVITANGMTGTVNVAADSAVTIGVQLSPGDKERTDADWWLICNAFGKWYYYTLDGNWNDIGSSLDFSKLRPVYQGKLFALSASEIFQIPKLSAGDYTMYFGVDTNMNGKLDTDSLVFKEISIVVNDSEKRSDFVTAGWSAGLDMMLTVPMPAAAENDLTERITDFVPLSNGYGVLLTGVRLSANEGQYSLRAVPLSAPEKSNAVSEISLGVSSSSEIIANGNLIYLVSNEHEYRADAMYYVSGKCRIRVMDFSEPESPITRGSIDIVGNYYAPIQGGNSYHNAGHILQMNGSTLILTYIPGYYGPLKDYDAGKDLFAIPPKSGESPTPQGGVKIVDFSDADHPKLVSELGLGNRQGSGYFLNGNVLYFSYNNLIEPDLNKRHQSKYYLGRIDLSNTSEPLRLTSINIPGGCIGMDSSGKYAFTLDTEWKNDTDWYPSFAFNSVRLDNDKAFLADRVTLRNSVSSAVLSGGFAYLGGYGVSIADISNPEKLKVYENSLQNTDTWLSILDVKNRKLFVGTYPTGIFCYDASDPANLRLDESVEHYSNKIAYSGSNAYIPMGYYGIWVKSLD